MDMQRYLLVLDKDCLPWTRNPAWSRSTILLHGSSWRAWDASPSMAGGFAP